METTCHNHIIICMRFIVSDNMQLSRKFGKWSYTHDSDVRTWSNGERLCLYFGYSIEGNLEELVAGDTNHIKNANGKFCVVVLWQDEMQVFVDYFCQTKVYYNTRNGLTVTNHIALLALTEHDIDHKSIKQFEDGWNDNERLYACKDSHNMEYMQKWNRFSSDSTVFHATSSIPQNFMLEHKGSTHINRIHYTQEDNLKAFETKLDWSTDQLEDEIHRCMEQHSAVIKREYNNICSSVSEGIDSTLQDQYFNADTRIMYHPQGEGTLLELPPKQKMMQQYRDKSLDIKFDVFDVQDIGSITSNNTIDPMLSYLDTVPTIWQVNQLTSRPDIVMYGQCADEMFMHVPKFLLARVPPPHRDRYKDSYGGRKSPAREFVDPYDGVMLDNWQMSFSHMAVPNLYNRDIENQTGVQTASLYADRRIFNLVHRVPADVQLSSMAHVRPQRNILHNHFRFPFATKQKDGAGYECRLVLKSLLTNTLTRVI